MLIFYKFLLLPTLCFLRFGEKEREGGRETERVRERERQRNRDKVGETERERERGREGERYCITNLWWLHALLTRMLLLLVMTHV